MLEDKAPELGLTVQRISLKREVVFTIFVAVCLSMRQIGQLLLEISWDFLHPPVHVT